MLRHRFTVASDVVDRSFIVSIPSSATVPDVVAVVIIIHSISSRLLRAVHQERLSFMSDTCDDVGYMNHYLHHKSYRHSPCLTGHLAVMNPSNAICLATSVFDWFFYQVTSVRPSLVDVRGGIYQHIFKIFCPIRYIFIWLHNPTNMIMHSKLS